MITYNVVIDGRHRAMPWRSLPTADAAEAEAARLRVLGLHARVVAADVPDVVPVLLKAMSRPR